MQKYMVTFDLRNAADRDYERVYKWAHENGGYRYFRGTNGVWGRLPSTTVVVALRSASRDGALTEFKGVLSRMGLDPSHLALLEGEPAATSDAVSFGLPEYANALYPNYRS